MTNLLSIILHLLMVELRDNNMKQGFFYTLCLRCNGSGRYSDEEDPCHGCNGDGYCPTNRLKPDVVLAYQISDALDVDEYAALSDANQAAVNIILSMGLVSLAAGTNNRAALWALFDAESTTRANLIALLGE